MNIDRNSFLILVSTLAAGGAGGYVAAEKRVFPVVDTWVGRTPEAVAEPRAMPSTSAAPIVIVSAAPPVASVAVPAGPVCDDGAGTVGDCPPQGLPTIEGGCGSFASIRCGELKTAMKPKVAAAAVECITKLTPQERCDAARVHLCGHLALMNACPDTLPGASAANAAGSGPAMASADAGMVVASDPSSRVGQICREIVQTCGASPVAPSLTECRQLLSGMNEAGRERTRACMKTHCFDRGLVGCEAAAAGGK